MTDPLQQELQARFRETTRVRLQDMATQLETLERDPAHLSALQALSRAFHALAGMGGTYGFARVSELGDEAEASILPLMRQRASVPPALVQRWREILDEVTAEIAD